MNVRMCCSILAVLCCATWSVVAQEAPQPPEPADALPPPARPADPPPAPADEASPSDQQPALDAPTSRGYAPGQAPGKQAPPQQAPWTQAPSKQAPMQQAPVQAPSKGTAAYGDQIHTMGYASNYNCAGCAPTYQQPTYSSNYRSTARRGLFGRVRYR